MIDLLNRSLLFVTGKGGVGKSTHRRLALRAGRQPRQAHARLRGRREGQPGRLLRERTDLVRAATGAAEPLGDVDGHRGVAEGVPEAAAQAPADRPDRAAGPDVRLRGQRRARREGDPHGRQVRAGRCASATTTSWWSTQSASGHIVGQLSAPQSINELVQVGMVRNQTGWMIDILNDPSQTGVVIVSAPEEMPVNETIELTERLSNGDQHRRRRGGREPRPARAVRTRRGGDLRRAVEPGASQGAVRASSSGDVRPGDRRRRSSRSRCDAPVPRTSPRLREHLPADLPLLYVPVPVRSRRTASAPPTRSPSTSAEELGL